MQQAHRDPEPASSFTLPRRRFLRGLAAVAALPLAACNSQSSKTAALAAGTTVLALGDSLTYGVGASAQEAYPSLLAAATNWNVINAGVSGNTSAQALQRLPDLLQQHSPGLAIVGIGGNDFLRRQPESETERNIRSICQQCLNANAQVVLVAVPGLSLLAAAGVLSDHAMYARIASDLKIPLLAKAWSRILADERLRSDQIHANAQGYAQFNDALLSSLRSWRLLA